MLKEADDLVEIALEKSCNGMEGFEPQVIAMQAATNTDQGSSNQFYSKKIAMVTKLFVKPLKDMH